MAKVQYLKKSKMYEFARQLCADIPKMKECNYSYYRGTEWLKWWADEDCDDGWIEWVVSHTGYAVYLSKIQHLDSEHVNISLKRQCFVLSEDLCSLSTIK